MEDKIEFIENLISDLEHDLRESEKVIEFINCKVDSLDNCLNSLRITLRDAKDNLKNLEIEE